MELFNIQKKSGSNRRNSHSVSDDDTFPKLAYCGWTITDHKLPTAQLFPITVNKHRRKCLVQVSHLKRFIEAKKLTSSMVVKGEGESVENSESVSSKCGVVFRLIVHWSVLSCSPNNDHAKYCTYTFHFTWVQNRGETVGGHPFSISQQVHSVPLEQCKYSNSCNSPMATGCHIIYSIIQRSWISANKNECRPTSRNVPQLLIPNKLCNIVQHVFPYVPLMSKALLRAYCERIQCCIVTPQWVFPMLPVAIQYYVFIVKYRTACLLKCFVDCPTSLPSLNSNATMGLLCM